MSAETIWKFPVPVTDEASVRMPAGAVILSVKAADPSTLFVWAAVDPTSPTEERQLSIRGTGHPLGEVGAHIATVEAFPLVWHVFEAAKR